MKTRFLTILLAMMLCATGSLNAQNFSLNQKTWSKNINRAQDISKMNYMELFYLKALVYATYGRWYEDATINSTLYSKCKWYEKTCLEYQEKYCPDNDFDFDEKILSAADKAFVQKINQRMESLEQNARKSNRLEPVDLCINMNQIQTPSPKMLSLLKENNIAFQTTKCEQLFNIYEENEYNKMPNFVTSDVYLQLTHMYLAYIQKYIEQTKLAPALENTYRSLMKQSKNLASKSKGEAKEMLDHITTYCAIGLNLCTDKPVNDIPANCVEAYNKEVAACRACSDAPSDFMNSNNFPYSLFRPRGHYTRSEEAKRFFRGMMWIQKAEFRSKIDRSFQEAMMLALVYNKLSAGEQENFWKMDDMIAQMMGKGDNVSIRDLAHAMKGYKDPESVLNMKGVKFIKDKMIIINEQVNRINKGEKDDFTINMMPQRFMVDNEILGNMADDKANAERAYPRGIDVFAAFGSSTAEMLQFDFYNDGKAWSKFKERAGEMKGLYEGWGNNTQTIYDKRLSILAHLASKRKSNQYAFYNTDAWSRKNLNTSLASWATLKHDAILYAEQPMLAECGGGRDLPLPLPVSFVEPNQLFWDELVSIVKDSRQWMQKLGFLDQEMDNKSEQLLRSVQLCQSIVTKELKGEPLSREDRMDLSRIGSSLEWLTLSFIDPELTLDSWNDLKGTDRQVAQVADIFTRAVNGCKKNGIKYAAVGNANAIYVLVTLNGQVYLTRGATYGYYEFVRPLEAPRMTDEEWQKELEKGKAPALPEWIQPYYIDKPAKVNQRDFYSTGC